jgi:hypothetical protein
MSIKLATGEGDISLTNLNEMSQKQNWQKEETGLGIKNWGSKHTIFRRGNEKDWLCEGGTSRLRTLSLITFSTMFVERKVCYSALFTNLVGWHVGAVSFPLSNVILAQLASCPLNDVMFCLLSGIINLSLYKHWFSIITISIMTFRIRAFNIWTFGKEED